MEMRKIGKTSWMAEDFCTNLEEQMAKEEITKAGGLINKSITRRDFLKVGAVGALAAASVASLKGGSAAVAKAETMAEGLMPVSAAEQQQAKTYPINGATRFVQHFIARGCKYAFGVAGSGERAMYDTLVRDDYNQQISFVQFGHEHNAAQAALGYALATEKPSVMLFHVGVGAPYAAIIWQGMLESNIPCVAWTTGGTTTADDWNQSAFTAWGKITEMMEFYTKWSYKIIDNTNIDNILNRAFRIAATAPMGPVFLNQIGDMSDQDITKIVPAKVPALDPANLLLPDPSDLNELADKLNNATNPYIITTKIGRNKAMVPLMVQLAESLGAGVIESGPQVMNFPTNHPCWQGTSTTTAANADVVLTIAASTTYAPAKAWVAHVYDNPVYLSQTANSTLFCDPQAALPELLKRIVPARDREARVNRLRAAQVTMKNGWAANLAQRANWYPASIHRVWSEVGKVLDKDSILMWVPGYQQTSIIPMYVERTVPGCYYVNPTSAMGMLSWGIGVQLANPDKRVISAFGDWEVHEGNLMEALYTSAHHNIPVVYLVLDNQSGMTVRSSHFGFRGAIYDYAMQGKPRYWSVELDQPRMDYVKLASAMGINGVYVDTAAGIGAAVQQALARTGRPSMIAVNSVCLADFTEGLSPERDRQK